MLELRARKKVEFPVKRKREMIATVLQGLEAEGIEVSMTKLCRWFEVPRRTMYYQVDQSAS